MADVAAKREARRRRILENSENRLQKITGRSKENVEKEKLSENLYVTSLRSSSNDDPTLKLQTLSTQKCRSFTEQDGRPDILPAELHSSPQQYEQSNLHSIPPMQDRGFSQSFEQNVNKANSSSNAPELVAAKSHHALLYRLFAGPSACILLAAVMYILVLTYSDPSSSKGILVPWVIVAITRWFSMGDFQEAQGSGILVAALILCNIRPNVLHRFKTLYMFTSTISKDFALYITSFVLFNWLVSMFLPHLSYIQFPS